MCDDNVYCDGCLKDITNTEYYKAKRYYKFCNIECSKKYLCGKCETRLLVKCDKCSKLNCSYCDDGYIVSYSWDDIDICHCHNCRAITIDELYTYFKDKYNESLTYEEIRKIVLKI